MNERNKSREFRLAEGSRRGGFRIDENFDELGGSTESGGGSSLSQYWEALQRQRVAVSILMLLGIGCGAASVILTPPMYEARTTLEMQGVNESFMNMNQVDPQATNENYSTSASNLQTQLQIMTSSSIKGRVLKDLEGHMTPPSERSTWSSRLRIRFNLESEDSKQRARHSLGVALNSVKAEIIKGTRIIELTNTSTDPDVAAVVLNDLAKRYIEGRLDARLQSTQRTSQWLSERLEEVKNKLDDSEAKLQARIRGTGLSESQKVLADSKAKQLQTELSQAQTDRINKQSRYETAVNTPADVLAKIVPDEGLRTHQQAVERLETQLAEILKTYTPTSERAKRVKTQLADSQAALQTEKDTVVRRLQIDFEEADRRERMLSRAYSRQSGIATSQTSQSSEIGVLQRQVEVNRQQYNGLMTELNQASLATALPTNNVQVIDTAHPARTPFTPQSGLNLALGGFAGILLGCLFAFAREQMNSTVRAPGHSLALLNVPELGVIPSAVRVLNGHSNALALESGADAERRELMTWKGQPSLLADSFRVTLASLMFEAPGRRRPKIIVITSPGIGEGKTTIATNLAFAMAETNREVLLIDADIRRPRLHSIFNFPNTWGLADLIEENTPIDHYPIEGLCRPSGVAGLSVLPTGLARRSLTNLLYSPRLPALLERFENEFYAVLIDTPPALMFPDARILGRFADGVLLVLRSGLTDRASAMDARRWFDEDSTPLLGSILNDWTARSRDLKKYHQYYCSSADQI